jgi:hypothetical protein
MKKTLLILTALASLTIAGLAQETHERYQIVVRGATAWRIDTVTGETWIMQWSDKIGMYWSKMEIRP